MHIPGAYLGLTVNIQVEAIYNILTISHKNSILDAYGSPRYKPAYLATKYIKRKNQKNHQKTDPSPLLHLDNMHSDFKVYMLYCIRWPIISHFSLNFLVFLKSFKHICFSIL